MSARWSQSIAFVAAFTLAVVAALRAPVELLGDERGFGAYATLQAEQYVACLGGDSGACRDPRWDEPYQGYGSANPKLGMLVLGGLDHATRWLPHERRVPARRLGMALLAGLSASLLAALTRRGGGPFGGLLAVGLLLAHPVFRAASAALLPDLPLLFASLGCLLALDLALETRPGARRAALLLVAGAAFGLALACKLYALALLPAGAAMLGLRRARLGLGGFGVGTAGLALGLGLFVALDPRLWWEPGVALRAMTVDHVAAQGGAPLAATAGGLPWLWLPFSLPLPVLETRTQVQDLAPSWPALFGATVALAGGLTAALRRRWLPLVWLASSLALCAWVISRFEPPWLYPRAFLLPAVAVSWLGGLIDPRAWRGGRAARQAG